MPETRPLDPEDTARQLAAELGLAVRGELLEMVRLLQEADPATRFGATEFKVRDLALQVAAKAYQQRLAQKKTAPTAPA